MERLKMKSMMPLIVLSAILLVANASLGANQNNAESLKITQSHHSLIYGGNATLGKASRDTVLLMGPWGSGAPANGQFQDLNGNPAWNGWTSRDVSYFPEVHWHISDYEAANLNSTPGNLALYCGDESIPLCDNDDVLGGYGNNWIDLVQFKYIVEDPSADCLVTVSGIFNHNTEPDYDYTSFRFQIADGPIEMESFDGVGVAVDFSYSINYLPSDYIGEDHDTVLFEILVTSDGGWSDQDCSYWGNGACQIDDLRVQCSNGNYDHTSDFQDGMGDWEISNLQGFGDFTDIWTNLPDLDPCRTNYSPQVAFIDDGTQVPGVGPSYCHSWCYGPGGFIINSTGGGSFSGEARLANSLESPILSWPGFEYTGAQLAFEVYRHNPFTAWCCEIYYKWEIRSSVDPDQIELAPWVGHEFGWIYDYSPEYIVADENLSNFFVPGFTVFQVRIVVSELRVCWGICTNNFTPAPYFDNFQITAYTSTGPHMSTSEINLAQDNFSENGEEIDLTNLALNNVRFDCAMNDAISTSYNHFPGDSITCASLPSRSQGELVENRLYYTMDRNPVFDSVRDAAWGASGYTEGIRLFQDNKYYYDLPDSGFLFPGDVLHYYFSSTEAIDGAVPMTSTLPSDLAGFGDFSRPLAYNPRFEVHALPSIDGEGNQPPILFWDDFGSSGGQDEWFSAFGNLGMEMGTHYDVYHTNEPASGEGNGLGGRASYEQIKGYSELLYTSGDLGVYTISNGDYTRDSGQDTQLLLDWFFNDSVDAFFCGNQLIKDLVNTGVMNEAFVDTIMNLTIHANSIRPLIGDQTAPRVLPVPGNSVFNSNTDWIAYGSCPGNSQFTAVEAGNGAELLARFTNPAGSADYIYSAATLNHSGDDRIITMPFDFMNIYTDANSSGGATATRVQVLQEILEFFETPGSFGQPVDAVVPFGKFTAKNYPNPFNPSTRIDFHLPRTGHLSLKVFNVRGELVKTLIDETRISGDDSIVWDGNNDVGEQASSGVFFYEIRTAGEVLVGKMVLIK